MRVLALEPYYGGSHRGFLDGWRVRSGHDWTLLTLPPYKWKWRMRHGAVTFASEIGRKMKSGERWDCLFCSDMLNLAELRGLAPTVISELPTVIYFHENQITYPVRMEKERDFQFGMTNITSALAADQVWFNSRFHRDEFLGAIPRFLNRMPDHRPLDVVERIRARSVVCRPGVPCVSPPRPERQPGPLRILWAARWEFDKNPEGFFEALWGLKQAGVAFRVSVLGESFREVPRIFDRARSEFRDEIDVWGFQNTRADYHRALARADVFVSTAVHEFFGISAVEAVAAGAYPLLPRRLAYPELLGLARDRPASRDPMEVHLYDGSPGQLRRRLRTLAEDLEAHGTVWGSTRERCRELAGTLCWGVRGSRLDQALDHAAGRRATAGDIRSPGATSSETGGTPMPVGAADRPGSGAE